MQQPLSLDPTVDAFTENYCVAQADVVLSHSRLALSGLERARRVVHAPPPPPLSVEAMRDRGGPDPANVTTVLHLGALRQGGGVDTFLRAAELVLRRDPRFRFVLRGDDTATDPFGRSYWEHVRRLVPPSMRERITYEGPVRMRDLSTMPPAGAQCVLPEGMSESPATAALAMAMGYVVTARGAGTAGEIVQDAGSVVPAGDPDALASILLASAAGSTSACEVASRARDLVLADDWTGAHAAELVRLHRTRRPEPRRRISPGRPLVSVVVPVRDQGGFLGEAIESARESGYRPLEIVVVDDGSTDADTIRTIDALDGVTVVRQVHRGLPAARNAGIGRCGGTYVLPLDADDRVSPGFIERAVMALEAEPSLSHVTGYVHNFGMFDSVFAPLGHVPDLCLVMDTYARATALFRREVFSRVGGYDESLPATEDWDLYIRLHEAGCQSDVLPVVGQQYRRHMGSMTFTAGSAMRVELIQNLVRRHLDILGPDGVVRLALTLVHLWKTRYEPSASAALLHRKDSA
jgi:GT2 family glycosyltransferase